MTSTLTDLLAQPFLVQATDPALEDLVSEIERRAAAGESLTAMYGETYDFHGPTLDSLKYYFVLASLARALRAAGAEIGTSVLIADVAVTRNEPAERHDEILALGRLRAAYVAALSDHFHLDLEVVLMSDYLDTDAFQHRLARVRDVSREVSEIGRWLEQTVPPSKVAEEHEKGFAYAWEEVATILEFDLKVGPPREKFYDVPARMVAEKLGTDPLLSVYLRPTYPLGFSFDFFFSNEEIEEYGVTAYKAGSKGLADHRVVIGATDEDGLRALVERSFVPNRIDLPNPVLDLVAIAELGEMLRAGELRPIEAPPAFFAGEIAEDELKRRACADVARVILEPLRTLLQRERQE